MTDIRGNLAKVNARIDEMKKRAAEAGRGGEAVTLCAVTKTRDADAINEAIAAGVTDIGENRVQELLDKYDLVRPVRWHMIGHLQTNKVKYIIDKVDLIHSVDSFRLAEEIDRRAEQRGKVMDILVQVNPAGEESKFGVSVDETDQLIRDILDKCPHVNIKGLMCMAPFEFNPEDAGVYFREVKKLFDHYKALARERLNVSILSMGMSNDYEVAILEGSSLVRIGTAIFGERR